MNNFVAAVEECAATAQDRDGKDLGNMFKPHLFLEHLVLNIDVEHIAVVDLL